MAKLIIWLGTACTVLAAEPVLVLPDGVPIFQYIYAFALSVWGCLAANIQRWAKAEEGVSVPLRITIDFVSSTSAGLIVFYAALHIQPPAYLAAIAVFAGGYGGSRLLEKVYQRLEKKVDQS
jgi:hypothetical protein